jgi:hypothetical protein
MALLATLAYAAPDAPAERWIDGVDVVVRAAPQSSAAAVANLARNAMVTLVREDSAVGYCEIRTVEGATGYTACRYLARSPVIASTVPGPPRAGESDPARAFRLQPNWSNLEQYASYLKDLHPSLPQQGPFPRDEALERMKAHLARGTHGPKPVPFADWADLKRKADRVRAQVTSDTQAPRSGPGSAWDAAIEIGNAIGLDDELHASSRSGGQRLLAGLVSALQFSSVTPSLFRSEAEVAPPASTAEEASGRFGMAFRQVVKPRPRPAQVSGNDNSPGLYDMLSRTDALARPVQRVQLNRDGTLRRVPSAIRKTDTLWYAAERPMCEGWVPGFAFGAADAGPWRFFGREAAANRKQSTNPRGSLFAFYTTLALPAGPAVVKEARMTLDRARTGFVQGTHLYYDLDADGIADLAVWEGQGKGPGDTQRQTTLTDDRWYRLVLVNINGAWKVLGSDTFSYGCGC